MKVALAQINSTVGDLAGNEAKILAAYQRGAAAGAELVVLPELAVTGYPPRDLLLRSSFVAENLAALHRLASVTGPIGLIVGYVGRNEARPGREVTNAVALLQHGRIVGVRTKSLLPTYDVFDEDRYFEPALVNRPILFNGRRVGLTICEDVWNDEEFWDERRYRRNPAAELAEGGAQMLFAVSASPWHLGKNRTRRDMLASLAVRCQCPVVYCNLVGGNDELVFDGASLVFNPSGELVAQAAMFEEDFLAIDPENAAPVAPRFLADEEKVFKALTLGLRDYVHKCGFKSAVLGLSGGIDSALTAVIAVEALGRENVRGLSLPSQYSSPGSLDDARVLAQNLGIQYEVVPIQPMFEAAKAQLKAVFAGRPEDVTEENLQARLRGVVLWPCRTSSGPCSSPPATRANPRWVTPPFTATCAAVWR